MINNTTTWRLLDQYDTLDDQHNATTWLLDQSIDTLAWINDQHDTLACLPDQYNILACLLDQYYRKSGNFHVEIIHVVNIQC